LLREIMEKKTLDDSLKERMKKLLQTVKETFVSERQAVAAK
jgi:hypothetical protein